MLHPGRHISQFSTGLGGGCHQKGLLWFLCICVCVCVCVCLCTTVLRLWGRVASLKLCCAMGGGGGWGLANRGWSGQGYKLWTYHHRVGMYPQTVE